MMDRLRSERGAAIIEFAIVAPVLLLLMFSLANIGLIVVGNSVGGNAAREGARHGILDIECADSYAGAPNAGHDGCATPGAAYTKITAAVQAKLVGLVKGTPTIAVRCLDGANTDFASATKACTSTGTPPVVPDVDLIEVKVTWSAVASSPFVSRPTHTDTARMVIVGAPK